MRALDALARIAELSLQAARQAGSLAVAVVRTAAEPVLGNQRPDTDERSGARAGDWDPPPAAPAHEPPAPPDAPAPPSAAAPEPAPAPSAPRAPRAPRPAPPPEPAHVDRDAVVVLESADAGAEDGVGAQIRVDEPWDGYDHMKARDVTAQLATADAAMLAVVRLYETGHRNRRTVLAEIDRRLAAAGG